MSALGSIARGLISQPAVDHANATASQHATMQAKWWGYAARIFTPAGASHTVSGTLKESGTGVAGRLVVAFRKRDHVLLNKTTSDGSGNWSIECGTADEVYVVAFDPTTYEAIVYDQVIPL